jgi:hypothetical protein
MLYVPLSHYWDVESLRVVLRTAGERTVTISGLQALVSRLEPATPVSDVRTFDSRLGDTLARPRFAAYLLTVFAVVAVFLAAIGAYGVLSYALSRRVREIGVRLALGAGGREVFGLLFRHGMTLPRRRRLDSCRRSCLASSRQTPPFLRSSRQCSSWSAYASPLYRHGRPDGWTRWSY